MSPSVLHVDVPVDASWLDAAALCRLAGVDDAWLRLRAEQGLLGAVAIGTDDAWRFNARALRHVARMAALERDFDAVPELAALVADLEEEIASLRARLDRVQGMGR